MLTSSRYYVALFAVLLAVGAVLVGGSLTPRTVSADHDDYDFCDPYYDQFDDDCHDDDHDFCDDYYDHDDDDYDYYDCDDIFGGHNDDYAGFLSMVASPSAINCGSTTHITVDIGSYYGNHHYDDDDYNHGHGYHYYGGVTVGLAANVPGTIAPATLQTTVNGRAVFSYTAPVTYRGPVYLSASTEFLTSSLILQVNCNIAQPSAPPISVAGPGTIQPPRTGDGGLVESNSSGLPLAFAAAALAGLGFLFASRRMSREG